MSQPLPIIQGRNTMPRKTNRRTKPHRRHRPRNQAARHKGPTGLPDIKPPPPSLSIEQAMAMLAGMGLAMQDRDKPDE